MQQKSTQSISVETHCSAPLQKIGGVYLISLNYLIDTFPNYHIIKLPH